MKKRTSIALVAAALLCGVTAASAATMAPATPSDTLALSSTQQKTAWKDLYTPSLNQAAPAGFSAKVGAVVPASVTTAPVTSQAAQAVPALKPYRFAMIGHKLLIVNPSDHKIADVISG